MKGQAEFEQVLTDSVAASVPEYASVCTPSSGNFPGIAPALHIQIVNIKPDGLGGAYYLVRLTDELRDDDQLIRLKKAYDLFKEFRGEEGIFTWGFSERAESPMDFNLHYPTNRAE